MAGELCTVWSSMVPMVQTNPTGIQSTLSKQESKSQIMTHKPASLTSSRPRTNSSNVRVVPSVIVNNYGSIAHCCYLVAVVPPAEIINGDALGQRMRDFDYSAFKTFVGMQEKEQLYNR